MSVHLPKLEALTEPYLLLYGEFEYKYYLIRQERKTVRLAVYPNLKIVLYCPLGYTHEQIQRFMLRKARWLKQQLVELTKLRPSNSAKKYVSGESFLYLGRQYKLVVEPVAKLNEEGVKFEYGRIILSSTESERNESLLENWYLDRAQQVFKQRYQLMLKKFDYEVVPELALRKMDKRWGSFLKQHKILLNPELIKACKECIDYVIIHELCHMKYPSHSSDYYRFLTMKCPNWKQIKIQLELRFT